MKIENRIWNFTNPEERDGVFSLPNPDAISDLYFPLGNQEGLMSAITPDMKGDIKTSQNTFLLPPVVTEDLHTTQYGRNFWVKVDGKAPWSAAGLGAQADMDKMAGNMDAKIDAGPGWFSTTRINKDAGLEAKITSFVPASGSKTEVSIIELKNISGADISFDAIAAVPVFARSADNQRDHRQVTTLLNRVRTDKFGVINTPTMSFDERGHKKNFLSYCVLGSAADGSAPESIQNNLCDFIGEGGSLAAPAGVYKDFQASATQNSDGREVIGALKFAKTTLKSGASASFVIVLGIADKDSDIEDWKKSFLGAGAASELEATRKWWSDTAKSIRFFSGDTDFDNWMVWVCCQPVFRKIFGCSFLPDFGYGRGGRGWRDLWQDCLALLLVQPDEAEELLLNNFGGVRIDGSNATIIGTQPGEFIADRNNIPRTWMDHGVWPLLTTSLYIEQSGNLDFLLSKQKYFKDAQAHRCNQRDTQWSQEEYGTWLKTADGSVYEGTVFEHLLTQNITQFFNVGAHNNMKLEGADWNDGLDMAEEKGESVAFSCMFSHNLAALADFADRLAAKGTKEFTLPEEFALLLDTVEGEAVDYSKPEARQARLEEFMSKVSHNVSGKTITLSAETLAADLRKKADYLKAHIANNEYISVKDGESFFNGYYNNKGERIEGDCDGRVRMTLTGQVFPIMSGVASEEQVKSCVKAAKKYLKDPKLGGYRLNTDFGGMQLDFGRAFSFAYGDKENGAFFSHMIVMWMFALYSRGFVADACEVLESIYGMSVDSNTSKIMPGVPEYFNSDGRGRYAFLTGSASWMLYTVLTQVFGVRGKEGDLLLYPKLMKHQFDANGTIRVQTGFGGKNIEIEYANTQVKDFGDYAATAVEINGKAVEFSAVDSGRGAVISKDIIEEGAKIKVVLS